MGLALSASAGGAPAFAPPPLLLAMLTVRQRIMVRVPARPMLPKYRTTLKEKKGPKCVDVAALGGALVAREDSVDLLMKGGARVRAEFESSCPALDYYSGFYIRPGADGRVCAGRDSVHSRSGGECRITRFRNLVPGQVVPIVRPKPAKRRAGSRR